MKNKNETDALNEAIILLQDKRAKQFELLKEQLHATYESLKPFNLIKSTFQQISSSPEIKNNIFSTAIGIGTGLLSKKLWLGSSQNPVKKLFGTFLQFATANFVSKHSAGIKSTGVNLLQRFLQHRKESKKNFNTTKMNNLQGNCKSKINHHE